jgi:hypothetical protein
MCNPEVAVELMNKCQNENYKWMEKSKNLLLEWGLAQQNGTIDQNIKKVFLCSIKCNSSSDINSGSFTVLRPTNGSYVGGTRYPTQKT